MRPNKFLISNRPITEFNGVPVYYIDGVPTAIKSIHGDLARGFIVNRDMTTKKCVVARGHGYFAHGETVETAMRDLEAKIISNMPVEEKVANFVKEFDFDKTYPVEVFYNWHSTLTGSCEMGRKSFMQNHGIKMEDSVTTKKFLDLTKNDFGSSVIKMVIEAYAKKGKKLK